jgi:type IV secretion system protein VirB9
MKTRLALLTLGVVMLSSSLSMADNRVRTEFYSQDHVVVIGGREGFETSIIFNDDEKIENVAVGDSLAWQVTPNKRANVLFLKPITSNARTNMTVVTDKRIYVFDLVPSTNIHATVYSMSFQYPNDPIPLPAQPAVKTKAPPTPARTMNFAWSMKGEKKLFPAHIWDDGKTIYLEWDKSVPIPAILARAADGTEGPVDYTVRDGTIVVGTQTRTLVLRSGKDVATLTDTGPVQTADVTTIAPEYQP